MEEQNKKVNTDTGNSVDVADLEALAKSGEKVPKAEKYRIRIDKEHFVVDKPGLTGRELLLLAGKQPLTYDIFQILRKTPKPQKIGLDEYVDFSADHAVERFVTLPKEQKDGSDLKRDFSLPTEDVEFLEKKSLPFEALLENRLQWLIIHEYPIPQGYNVQKAAVALQIAPNYPAVQIDMAYFYPPLSKNNGRAINALTHKKIGDKIFQRWSRHRQPGEWRPGLDNISTHLILVENWLEKELNR